MKKHAVSFRYQVPRPPALFVGRAEACLQLEKGWSRSPLVVVSGPEGIGKSALARFVAHRAVGESPTVQIRIRSEEGWSVAMSELFEALGMSDGATDTESPDPLEAALDRADALGAVVVLEDVHHLAATHATADLGMLAAYARRSRWLLTSRQPLADLCLPEQHIALGPLDAQASLELAKGCLPDAAPERWAAVVQGAAGSPLEIRRRSLAASSAAEDVDDGDPALPEGAHELLEVLAQTRSPVTLDDLGAVISLPAAHLIELLVLAGILRDEPGQRVRLAEPLAMKLNRSLKAERSRQIRHTLADRWGQRDDPDAVIEAVRLALELGRDDRAAEIIATHLKGASPVFVERLWTTVRPHADRLSEVALGLAVAAGTADSRWWVSRQTVAPTTPLELRLAWLEARHTTPGAPSIVRDTEHVLEEAEGSGRTEHVLRSRYLLADALFNAGRLSDALGTLEGSKESSGPAALLVQRDALMARVLEMSGRPEEARQWASSARQRAQELPPERRAAAARRAHLIASDGFAGGVPDVSSEAGFWPIFLAGLRAGLDGRASRCEQALKTLEGQPRDASTERVMFHLLSQMHAMLAGPTHAVMSASQAAVSEARASRQWLALQWAYIGSLLASWLCVQEPAEHEWPTDMPPPGGPNGRLIALLQQLHRLDWPGQKDTVPRLTTPVSPASLGDTGSPTDAGEALGHAMLALITGRPEEGLLLASRVIRLASVDGFRWGLFYGRVVQLIGLAVLRREAQLQRALEPFWALVESMDAPFASQSLRFIEATLGKVLRAELLEELADGWECNAVTAYWSRSLLRGASPPSASHGLVVSAIRHRWPKDWIRRYGGHSVQWCRGWGVDLSRQLIWRLDGRIVELARRPSMSRLIEAIARHGGQASKEVLAEFVWDTSYHPLDHDPKLQVAIGRLRKLLGDDTHAPKHLVTVEDGYAVHPAVPFSVVALDGLSDMPGA